jgi:hypothetical protein
MTLYAHCFRSGEIKISRKRDERGMLCIGSGPGKELRKKITARARLSRDGETLLVPGLPEAEIEKDAFDAVNSFVDFLYRE